MASSAERLGALRAQLESRARELRAEVDRVERERADEAGPLREIVEDPAEQAEHRRQDSVRGAEEDRDAAELREIDAALALIDAGGYGDCVDCGLSIPLARLQAQPTALRCIACQTSFEQRHAAAPKAPPA